MRFLSDNLLALDLATKTGWCHGAPGDEPTFGTHVLPSTDEDIGTFGNAFEDWLYTELADLGPQAVVYEQPSVFAKTTPVTNIKLNGLACVAEMVCEKAGVRVYAANPSKLKKFWTGRGNAKKPDMIDACKRYGWHPRDDNAADAIALWAWGIYCFAPKEFGERFALAGMGAGKL